VLCNFSDLFHAQTATLIELFSATNTKEICKCKKKIIVNL